VPQLASVQSQEEWTGKSQWQHMWS
jgi:hypothetical protein